MKARAENFLTEVLTAGGRPSVSQASGPHLVFPQPLGWAHCGGSSRRAGLRNAIIALHNLTEIKGEQHALDRVADPLWDPGQGC